MAKVDAFGRLSRFIKVGDLCCEVATLSHGIQSQLALLNFETLKVSSSHF